LITVCWVLRTLQERKVNRLAVGLLLLSHAGTALGVYGCTSYLSKSPIRMQSNCYGAWLS